MPAWEPRLLTKELPCAMKASQQVMPVVFPGPITLQLHPSLFTRISVVVGLQDPCCRVTLYEIINQLWTKGQYKVWFWRLLRLSPFQRGSVFELALFVFHYCMSGIHLTLEQHWG